MTGTEFKTARVSRLKISQAMLANLMKTPKRTIQDIEALHDHEIRGVYEVVIQLLCERDKWVMTSVIDKVTRIIDREHPLGIKSIIYTA